MSRSVASNVFINPFSSRGPWWKRRGPCVAGSPGDRTQIPCTGLTRGAQRVPRACAVPRDFQNRKMLQSIAARGGRKAKTPCHFFVGRSVGVALPRALHFPVLLESSPSYFLCAKSFTKALITTREDEWVSFIISKDARTGVFDPHNQRHASCGTLQQLKKQF